MKQIKTISIIITLLLICNSYNSFAQSDNDDFDNSFSYGREYFIMRSGNAKLILQTDKQTNRPAYSYLLFDAEIPGKTSRKENAFNYSKETTCTESALQVVLGKNAFTALGINTTTHWVTIDGIPSVEIVWWAGGIRVQENFIPLKNNNTFIRRIKLTSQDMAGVDNVKLRLSLPKASYQQYNLILIGALKEILMGITFVNYNNSNIDKINGAIETESITLKPRESKTFESLLMAVIPIKGINYSLTNEKDVAIDPIYLTTNENKEKNTKGLREEFFNNINLKGNPVVTKTDTNTINYWGLNAPAEGVKADSFSIRWTGKLKAPASGVYKFSLIADDKARLYIDNKLLIDCWDNSFNVLKTADIKLDVNKETDIRLEFCDLDSYAGLRLKWIIPEKPIDKDVLDNNINEFVKNIEALKVGRLREQLEMTNNYWNNLNKITINDSLIKNLYNNVLSSLHGMVSENGRMDAGIFEYGNQWVRDASSVALGFVHSGNFEAARSTLNHILTDLVTDEGATFISGGLDEPDREELDQMGELVYSLKEYYNWSGDSSLIKTFKNKIIAMIERPLKPLFRDYTGMVHNRREYWERTYSDGYELAYQTWMIRGLKDAADLADLLEVPDKAKYWKQEADVFYYGMVENPTIPLVSNGKLIKRRLINGEIDDVSESKVNFSDVPGGTERYHKLNPDASSMLPIILHVINPKSNLSVNTLNELEKIWDARWNMGGYERYHSSSQSDQPGPWCFSTAFIARAQHEAGLLSRSRRTLEWLYNIQGGNSGAWHEEIPLIKSQIPTSGIVPWASAEVAVFVVKNLLGVTIEKDSIVIKPILFPEDKNVTANLRYHSNRLIINIDKPGNLNYALVNNTKIYPQSVDSIKFPKEMFTGDITIDIITKP